VTNPYLGHVVEGVVGIAFRVRGRTRAGKYFGPDAEGRTRFAAQPRKVGAQRTKTYRLGAMLWTQARRAAPA
jgi:hypothetical protein